MAELPLARAHRRRRVALGELDRVEPLRNRALHVLRGHVLADADEALSSARVRGLRIDLAQTFAGHAADRFDSCRELRRNEYAELGIEFDARSGLGEERVGGLSASRGDDEVAVDALAVEHESSHATLAALSCELARSELPDVDDARHGDPRLPKVVGDLEPLVVGREDDCAVARLDRELADEPAHTAGEHHPDEVVPREDERLLGGSRGDDDPPGAEPVENGAGVDGNEPALPDPERTSRGEHLDALELHSLQPGVLVDEHDARTPGRRSPCGSTAGLSTAHDEHACLPVLGVIAAGVPCVLVELP